jgi:hypothetical protein
MAIIGTPVISGTYDGVIAAIQAQTSFSVQTPAEAIAGTNLTANILYDTASRKQGNFTVFLTMAEDQLDKDLLQIGKTTVTDAQKEKALAYLIASYQEAKDPDIFANSVSFGGYSVSRSNGPGYLAAYRSFLDSLPATNSNIITEMQDANGLIRARDDEKYPDAWRLTGLERSTIDPF